MRMRIATAAFGLLTTCTVGPNFVPPAPPAAASFNDPSAHQQSAVNPGANPDPQWWNDFHDKTLTALIDGAIAGNPNLQEGLLRVEEAHQSEVTQEAAGLPTLNATGSYMREQLGIRGILESKGAYSQLNSLADANSPLNQYSPGLGTQIDNAGTGALDKIAQPINLYQYELTSSWELDLFGRVRRAVEQAHATTAAQAEAANDALVMLEAQVAQEYVQLRAAQEMQAMEQQNIDAATQSLDLTIQRQQMGLAATDLDVEQARTQLLSYQAQLPAYEKQAQQAIDDLNILTGQPPGTLDAMLTTPAPLPTLPAVIGIGVPSTLARRRPDVREAEDELHAATANVGVAVASFYPDITLMGSAGLRATDASFLTNWASLFYSAGPSISLPIFQGGKLIANLRTARAEQASAALSYRGTVLNALREVEDGLVAYRTDQTVQTQTAALVKSASFSLYLSNNRYQNGLSSYLQVLDAERTLVSARQQLVQADVTLANDVVTLYTALGGGWQNSAASIPVPPVNPLPPPLPAATDSLAEP